MLEASNAKGKPTVGCRNVVAKLKAACDGLNKESLRELFHKMGGPTCRSVGSE